MADVANKSMKHKTGFTLIELLIVVAIIGILIAIAVPSISGARNAAKKTASKSQLHSLSVAIETYYTNFGDYPGLVDENDWNSSNAPATNFSSAQSLFVSLSRAYWTTGAVSPNVSVSTGASSSVLISSDPNYRPIDHSTGRSYDAYVSNPKENSAYYFKGAPTSAANLLTVPCFVDPNFNNPAPILYFRAKRKYDTSISGMNKVLRTPAAPAIASFYSDSNIYLAASGVATSGTPGFSGFDTSDLSHYLTTFSSNTDALINDLFDKVGSDYVAKGAYVLVSPGPDGKYDFVNNKSDNIVQAGGN